MNTVTRLFDIPYYQQTKHPLECAFVTKYNGQWVKTSTEQYIQKLNVVSRGLLRLGIQKNDKIAVISSTNRTEWHVLDMGILQIGAQNVPIYPTINLEDFEYKDVGRCVLYQNNIPAAINGNVAILTLKDSFKDIIDLRYISFFLNYKDTIRNYIYQKSVGEKVKRLSKLDFENILIIISSLEVQKQTVDKFINLKIKFEQDIEEIENRIKLIDGYSKVYMEHVFKFY